MADRSLSENGDRRWVFGCPVRRRVLSVARAVLLKRACLKESRPYSGCQEPISGAFVIETYARWEAGSRLSLYFGRRTSSLIGTGVPSHSAFLLWSS
jgi:hypothetical protein